jgi:hypothetical protein
MFLFSSREKREHSGGVVVRQNKVGGDVKFLPNSY